MKKLCVIVALFLVVMLGGCGSQQSTAQSDNAAKSSSPSSSNTANKTSSHSSNAATSSDTTAKASPNSQPNSVITQEKSAGIITDFLLKKGISKDKDPNLVIALDRTDTADGKEYFVFQVFDNMSDHTATIGWYGVQKNDGSLYDFILMKPIK